MEVVKDKITSSDNTTHNVMLGTPNGNQDREFNSFKTGNKDMSRIEVLKQTIMYVH